MTAGHWFIMGLTAALTLATLMFSLFFDPKRRAYALIRRLFFSCSLLLASGAAGGIGLNAVTGTVTALLGMPGYAALVFLTTIR